MFATLQTGGLGATGEFMLRNLAFLTIKTATDRGWDAFGLVDGWVEGFADATDVADLGGATAAAGYLHNPGGNGPNVATVGIASASSTWAPWGTTAAVANDGAVSTGTGDTWMTEGAGAAAVGEWWRLDFGATPRALTKWGTYVHGALALYQADQVVIEYSDDGAAWIVAATWAKPRVGDAWYYVEWAQAGAHRYWRQRVTVAPAAGAGNYGVALGEVRCYEAISPADGASVSTAIAADAVASQVRVLIHHQAIDALTIGTDCMVDVTADGGATWHEVPLALDGFYDASSALYSGVVAVTPGASVKWRWRRANAKQQALHAIWLQWG